MAQVPPQDSATAEVATLPTTTTPDEGSGTDNTAPAVATSEQNGEKKKNQQRPKKEKKPWDGVKGEKKAKKGPPPGAVPFVQNERKSNGSFGKGSFGAAGAEGTGTAPPGDTTPATEETKKEAAVVPAGPEIPKYQLKNDWVCYRDKKCPKSKTFLGYLKHIQYHCPARKPYLEERTGVKPSDVATKLVETPEALEATRKEVMDFPLVGEPMTVGCSVCQAANLKNPALIGISPGNAFFSLVNCMRIIYLAVKLGAPNVTITCMGDLHSVNGSDLAPSVIRRHHNKAISRLVDIEFLIATIFPQWVDAELAGHTPLIFKLWHELLDKRHLLATNTINHWFEEKGDFHDSIMDAVNAVAKLRSHSAPAAHHYLLEETSALTLIPMTSSNAGLGLNYLYPGCNFQACTVLEGLMVGEESDFITHTWVKEAEGNEERRKAKEADGNEEKKKVKEEEGNEKKE